MFNRVSFRHLLILGIVVAGPTVLTGCLSSQSNTNAEGQVVAGDGRGWATALLYGGRGFSEPPPTAKREYSCPRAEILDGTVAYRSGGDAGGARGVAYQASINDFARECALTAENQLSMRVGVRGRIILGESGKPGTFTIPVRVAVRKGDQTVYSRVSQASASIPAGDSQATFVVLDENLRLPVGVNDPGDEYTVLIGLDPQSSRPTRNRRR